MASYKGSAADASRARELDKARGELAAEFERQRAEIKKQSDVQLKSFGELFQTEDSRAEESFKQNTIGLVSAERYKQLRLEAEERLREEEKQRELERKKAKKRRAKQRKQKLKALSFVDEEDEGEEGAGFVSFAAKKGKKEKKGKKKKKDEESEGKKESASVEAAAEAAASAAAAPASASGKKRKSDAASSPSQKKAKVEVDRFGKDPTVATHFLPDRVREEEDEQLRQELAAEFLAQQEKVKAEQIEITYSYWDGSGHRRTTQVTKGARIEQFLEQVRRELSDSFHELRGVSVENLIYVKEDLLIPHHYSFYDLIVSKARGKSGPLFRFDVHDDVRLRMDSRVEKDESHAGKVLTRAWYERNKHIFPASRWEVYDPAKQFEKYTIKG